MAQKLSRVSDASPAKHVKSVHRLPAFIGDGEFLHRYLIVPWYIVMILLIAGDWILGSNPTVLWSRLIAVVYIAIIDGLFLSIRRPVTLFMLGSVLFCLGVITCGWTYYRETSLFAGTFLPLAGILYCLVFIIPGFRSALVVTLPFMMVCGAFVYGVITSEGFYKAGWDGFVSQLRQDSGTSVPSELVHGVVCLGLAWLALLVLSRVQISRPAEVHSTFKSAKLEGSPAFFLTRRGREQQSGKGRNPIFTSAEALEVKRYRSYFRWRLLLTLTVASILFIIALMYQVFPLWFHFTGAGLLLSLVVISMITSRIEKLRYLYLLTFISCLILAIGWNIIAVLFFLPRIFAWIGYYFLFAGLCCFPVPIAWSAGTAMILLLSGVVMAGTEALHIEGPVVFLTVLLFVHLSRRHYQEFSVQSLITLITRRTDLISTDRQHSVVEGLLGLFCLPAECDRVVLVGEAGESSLLISSGTVTRINVDASHQRGFVYHLEDFGGEQGWLSTGQLPEQLQILVRRWFGSIPVRLFYIRVRQVQPEKVTDHIVLIPLSTAGLMHGVKQMTRMFVTLTGAIRAFLLAVSESGAELSGTRIDDSFRGADVSEVVHYVNNAVQNLSISCERLSSLLGDGESSAEDRERMRLEIDAIGKQSRLLAVRVTDVKLLDELLKQQNKGRLERVSVRGFIDDIEDFILLLGTTPSEVFSFTITDDARSEAMEIASKEYLLTALRSYLYACFKSSQQQGGTVELECYRDGDWIVCALHDSILRLEIEEKQAITRSASALASGNLRIDSLRALRNLSRLSEGEFIFASPRSDYLNRLELRFSVAAVVDRAEVNPGNWTLLVDDSPEVLTFYARIAQALRLPYETATDVQEALSLVDQKGCPRFVVTDIQLQNSSGIELVRELRARFGEVVPVVVVSGGASDQIIQHVQELGATRFLRKPVGRRRLFKEFQQLSGLSG